MRDSRSRFESTRSLFYLNHNPANVNEWLTLLEKQSWLAAAPRGLIDDEPIRGIALIIRVGGCCR
jgi:hypothetical protein